jgi:hypothetical protein
LKISDLRNDSKNANKGTKRGADAVAASLKSFGAGRSILIDKHGVIIAGNATARNAAKAGIENVIVVPTDGSQLIAVQRTDLDLTTDAKAKQLAIADNRTAELGLEWDASILGEFSAEMDLKPFFTADELGNILGSETETEVSDDQTGELSGHYNVMVECGSEVSQLELMERLMQEGFACRSLIA